MTRYPLPMAQTYSFPIPADRTASELLAQAKEAGRPRGVVFQGDGLAGRFQGPAEGTYTVVDRVLTIVVEKKPAFVPWKMIENALKDLFSRP